MHLPLLHLSNRPPEQPALDDPFKLGQVEGRDFIPWLADPDNSLERALRRTALLDTAALAGAALGSEVMYFALIGAMYSAYDRRTALALSAVILPSVFVNQLFKSRFRFPRPPHAARHELAFVAPGDFTFPSGHAQNAVALGLFLALRSKHYWSRVAGFSLALSIPMSRVYLGVHYPRDVIAGAMLGAGSLFGVQAYEKRFVAWWQKNPRGSRSFTVAIALTIVGVLSGTSLAAFPLGVGGGMALGHDLSGQRRFRLDRPHGRRRIAQGVIGLIVTFGVGFAVRPLLKRESALAGIVAGTLTGIGQTYGIPLLNDFAKRFALLRRQRLATRKRN